MLIHVDELVPVKRGLLSQALQTRGGGLEARLTKALPTLHSPSLSISLFSFSPSHTTNTHTQTHRTTTVTLAAHARRGLIIMAQQAAMHQAPATARAPRVCTLVPFIIIALL